MEVYRIKDLSFTYPLRDREALSNISLNINSGEFVVICGKSGSGKSTFIRQLKTVLTPHGKKKGEVLYCGQPLKGTPHYTQVSEIGYVFQNPDNQIVTDKVWHELAFGLESLGYDNSTIRLRVAEMASFFGIHNWFYKNVSELSGGEKQILNLAGVMVMQPKVLILDEPASQLDPIAASDFIDTIKKINRELGTTIIMTEHRLEDIMPIADRLIVMDGGRVICDGLPEKVGLELKGTNHPMFNAMTSAMRIYAGAENGSLCPVTVNQGKRWIEPFMKDRTVNSDALEKRESALKKEPVVKLKNIWFRYEKNLPDVIKNLTLDIGKGEFYCILGGNGTGKTTTLSIINGIQKPYRGKVLMKDELKKRIAMLPQSPQTLFVKKTVEEDLFEMLAKTDIGEKDKRITEMAEMMELKELLLAHPYDLSGGEQQRAAMAKVLLTEPEILLLDEPTKGLDNFFKDKLAGIIKILISKGITVVMVSHDIEFCAKHGDRCALMFDGSIITSSNAREFFSGNSFYTTAANRIARNICPMAVTVEDVIMLCKSS